MSEQSTYWKQAARREEREDCAQCCFSEVVELHHAMGVRELAKGGNTSQRYTWRQRSWYRFITSL